LGTHREEFLWCGGADGRFGRIEGIADTGLGDWEDAGVAVFPNPFTGAVRITGVVKEMRVLKH
jgi:hypothetical protein